MSTRFVACVAVAVILGAVRDADAASRVTGIAYTENATERITIRVWALGETILKEPGKLDAPLAETTAAPGAEFSLDLADAQPPWEVEVAAPGHLAAAFKVILPGQMTLPPIWLPAGKELVLRVDAGGKTVKGTRIDGSIARLGRSAEPGRWNPVVPRSVSDAAGVTKVRVPDGGLVVVTARGPDGRFARVSKSLPVIGTLTLKIDSRTQRVTVRNPRGEPVPGVALATTNTPPGDRAVTDATGKAVLQVPSTGDWAVVALGNGVAGRAVGGAGKDELVITVDQPQELRLAWSGAQGPVIFEPAWLPSALSGGAPVVLRGERGSLPFLPPGGIMGVWGPRLARQALSVGSAQQVLALRFAAEARIEGTVVDDGNNTVAWVPVWRWEEPTLPGMVRIRRGRNLLERPLLPDGVSAANGSFVIACVSPGPTKVSARKTGMPTAESEVIEVAAGSTSTVTLQLKRGAPLSLQTQDANGRILSGVTVKAFRSDDEGGGAFIVVVRSLRDADEPVAVASTDKEGKLTFVGLRPGRFYLKLELPGYVTRTVDGELPAEGKDLGAQVLEPGVAVSGRVVDERGQAVADAEITADPLGGASLRGAANARSDATGFFVIADQPRQGELYLSARGDKIPSTDPVKVTLPPAGPIEIKVRRARTLEGRVVDERSGDPVAGARVNASKQVERRFGGGMMQVGTATFRARAESDENGAFRLDGMDVGECTLDVAATGFKPFSRNVTIPEEPAARAVTIVLRKGLTLRGKVLDPMGAPVAAIDVSASAAGAGQGFAVSLLRGGPPARTDPDGVFVVDDLEKGRYQLVASDESGAQAREIAEAGQKEDVTLRLQAPGSLQVRVAGPDGSPITGARVNGMGRGSTALLEEKRTDGAGIASFEKVTAGSYQVMGSKEGLAGEMKSVAVESGRTAEVELTLKVGGTVLGKVVGLSPEELKGCDIAATRGSAQPKPDGTFRLEGVPVGINEVTAFVMPQGKHRSVRVDVKDISTPVEVEIDFASGVTVSGTVRRAGRPAPSVTVQAVARGQRGGSSVTTDADGAWEIKGLDPGELEVSALNDRGQPLVVERVQAVRDARIDLEIPGGAIAGRITDAQTRQPLSGAQASIQRRDPPPLERTVQADDAGAFRATELPDGIYTVHAQAAAYSPAEAGATVSMGRSDEVEIALRPEQRVTLILREADGGAPDQVLIQPSRDGRVDDMLWVSCDRAGRATISALAPGSYTALIVGRGGALARFAIPGPDLSVQFAPLGRLAVTARLEAGGAPWRVRIVAVGSGLVMPVSAFVNPARGEWAELLDGTLRMRAPAGTYTVQTIDPRGTTREQQVTVPPDGDVTARFDR